MTIFSFRIQREHKKSPDILIQKLGQKWSSLVSDKRFSEILVGSAWALGARVLTIVLGMVVTITIARLYGAEVVGNIAFVTSLLLLTTILTILGTDTSVLRLIPQHLSKHSATSAFNVYQKTGYVVITMSLFAGILLFFAAKPLSIKLFSKPNLSFYLSLSAVFMVFKSLMLLNLSSLRGLKLVRVFALMLILPQCLNLTLLYGISLFVSTIDVPVYAMLGSYALTGVIGWVIMKRSFRIRMKPSDPVQPISAIKIIKISLPMFLNATMSFVTGQTGVILLTVFHGQNEVGYYSIAVKLATLTSFLIATINSFAAPIFSELFYTDKIDELFNIAKKSAKLLFWTSTPILVFLICLGKPILLFMFGKEFVAAYGAMTILVLGQFVNAISGLTGLFMNMTGREKQYRNILLIATLINVFCGILLIPPLGIIGASVAAMISLILWNLLTLFYIKLKYGKTISYVPFLHI